MTDMKSSRRAFLGGGAALTLSIPWLDKLLGKLKPKKQKVYDISEVEISVAGIKLDGGFDIRNAPQLDHEFLYTWRDGRGGYRFGQHVTDTDPNHFDNGYGEPVPASGFQVQRIYTGFHKSDVSVWTYGQALYESMEEAEFNIFKENPVVPPMLKGGTFTQALIVKAGITELDKIGDAKFVDIYLGAVRDENV